MKKLILNTAGMIILFLTVMNAGAQNVYMKAEGTKTGIIKDQTTSSKYPDRIELAGYSFETSSAAGSGPTVIRSAAGRGTRSPLTIIKNNGQSSILFYHCSITNEKLKSVVLEVYKITPAGTETLEQTITLTDATVSYFKQSFDKTMANADLKGPKDEIRFTYQKINITYVNGGVTAEDNWNGN